MIQKATLGGGCFWCLEAVYQEMDGVEQVRSGYMGGDVPNPTYEQVCTGRSGHVEVVEVTFNTDTTSFDDVLDVFFTIHDPTTLNRQGNDVGPQYRSVIFYHTDEQRQAAEAKIRSLSHEGVFADPIVTTVEPAGEFYVGEDYHQNYYRDHPRQSYCAYIISPKLAKFRTRHAGKRRQ